MRVRACACVCVCMRACACVCACVYVCARAHAYTHRCLGRPAEGVATMLPSRALDLLARGDLVEEDLVVE